jgi:hypothetical protein
MQHLNPETLARLVDERPSAGELEHLARCSVCAAELQAMREQTLCLASLLQLTPPATIWNGVARQLAVEGLIGFRPAPGYTPLLRAAAAIAIFIAGSLIGTFLISPQLRGGAGDSFALSSSPASDAATALQLAEDNYLEAVTRFAEATDVGEGMDPINRLAALEGIVLTTGAALREAPADPVINNYHLTALGQREALLRQIERVTTQDEWF